MRQADRGRREAAGGASPWWARLLLALAAVGCLWAGGFLHFVHSLPQAVADETTATDAIVVLTGGADRLGAGVDLLRRGMAEKLLISGVNRAATQAELQRRSHLAPERFACCVELGREAADTVGNAIEAELWMRRAGFDSLRLVTASYHMPRSLLLFRAAMRDVALVAHPVFPANVKVAQWWRYPGTARLLAGEFTKYLVSLIRVRLAGAGAEADSRP